MNIYAVGTKLLASVGKKKKTRIVEILIIEWSPTGTHFKAEIRDGVNIKFGWCIWTDYKVVELINNPMADLKNSIELTYKSTYEQQLTDASADKLSTEAANAINSILEYFADDKQEEIRTKIFKLRSIKDLNEGCKYGLMNNLQEDMISEFASIYSKLLPKKSSTGMGVPVGVLTGKASPLAPKDGFVDIAKPTETPVTKDPIDIHGGQGFSDIAQNPVSIETPEVKMTVTQSDAVGAPQVCVDETSIALSNDMVPPFDYNEALKTARENRNKEWLKSEIKEFLEERKSVSQTLVDTGIATFADTVVEPFNTPSNVFQTVVKPFDAPSNVLQTIFGDISVYSKTTTSYEEPSNPVVLTDEERVKQYNENTDID